MELVEGGGVFGLEGGGEKGRKGLERETVKRRSDEWDWKEERGRRVSGGRVMGKEGGGLSGLEGGK